MRAEELIDRRCLTTQFDATAKTLAVAPHEELDRGETHHPIGFSTGALERGNYRRALDWMRDSESDAVEVSALRFNELEPTVRDLDRLDLSGFRYISFHAPSSFEESQEDEVLRWLEPVRERGWNIVVHPDVIYTPSRYEFLGDTSSRTGSPRSTSANSTRGAGTLRCRDGRWKTTRLSRGSESRTCR
ncbi:MAG: hypothetical protein WD342_11060 [Verrucomicrobiales bacterium]